MGRVAAASRKGQAQHCRLHCPHNMALMGMQELADEAGAVLQLPEVLAAAAFTLSVSTLAVLMRACTDAVHGAPSQFPAEAMSSLQLTTSVCAESHVCLQLCHLDWRCQLI